MTAESTLAAIRETTPPQPEHSWRPVDLVALGDTPPPEATISGLSYPASLALHYGEPEAVKTWLSLILCLEQIRAGRHALYIDFEMSAQTIRGRLRDLGADDDELGRLLYLSPSEPVIRPAVDELIAAYQPSIAVIDAMAGALALHQLDGNNGDDVERFYTLLAPLRAHGAAVHLVDHVTKDRETRGRWPIGSQRKLGAADTGLSIEMVTPFGRGRTGLARLRVTKDRHGALTRPIAAELQLVSDPDTGRITWALNAADDNTGTSNGWKPTVLMDRILDYLSRNPEPISRSALADAVHGNRAYKLKAIECLLDDERLALDGKKVVPVPRNVPGTRNDS